MESYKDPSLILSVGEGGWRQRLVQCVGRCLGFRASLSHFGIQG
jgi:hypothetical protein